LPKTSCTKEEEAKQVCSGHIIRDQSPMIHRDSMFNLEPEIVIPIHQE